MTFRIPNNIVRSTELLDIKLLELEVNLPLSGSCPASVNSYANFSTESSNFDRFARPKIKNTKSFQRHLLQKYDIKIKPCIKKPFFVRSMQPN